MELGQRYSVMVKLDQEPGSYSLRYSTYPSGDMQQVLQGRSIVVYDVSQHITRLPHMPEDISRMARR